MHLKYKYIIGLIACVVKYQINCKHQQSRTIWHQVNRIIISHYYYFLTFCFNSKLDKHLLLCLPDQRKQYGVSYTNGAKTCNVKLFKKKNCVNNAANVNGNDSSNVYTVGSWFRKAKKGAIAGISSTMAMVRPVPVEYGRPRWSCLTVQNHQTLKAQEPTVFN